MTHEFYINSSNIKICLIEKKELKTINITIHIPIGASTENNDEIGIAHFLEHMLFTNTKKYSEEQINNLVDYYGADINAETHYNKTLYYINGLSEYTLELFDILYEIYFNGIITNEKFEREKNIIIQELNNLSLIPGYQSEKLSKQIMFNDRYKKSIGGEPEDILSINIDKLKNFKKKHYIPNNTTIIFFGNFNKFKVLNELKSKFGSIKNYIPNFNKINSCLNYNYNYNNDNYIIKYIKTDNEQIIVNFYFKTISKSNIWNYKINILSNILTNSLSALLTKKLRIDLGLTYNINSFLESNRDNGIFNITFNCANTNINKCIKEILNILNNLQNNYINELYIIKSINKFKTILLNESSKNNYDLNDIIKSLTYNITSLTIDEILNIIKDINKEEINYLCKHLFNQYNTIIIIEGKL
jgi:predicted Zn-dependent peptidase